MLPKVPLAHELTNIRKNVSIRQVQPQNLMNQRKKKMDKLKMHTPNKADDNFKKLADMFPNAVTETIDENGEVVRAIDKDVLMQEINTKVVDGNEERYQFTWPDRRSRFFLPMLRSIRPCVLFEMMKQLQPERIVRENHIAVVVVWILILLKTFILRAIILKS